MNNNTSYTVYQFSGVPKFNENWVGYSIIQEAEVNLNELYKPSTYIDGSIVWEKLRSMRNKEIYFHPVNCKEFPDYRVYCINGELWIPSGYATTGIMDLDTNTVLGIPLDEIQKARKVFCMSRNSQIWVEVVEGKYTLKTTNTKIQGIGASIADILPDNSAIEPVGNYEAPMFIKSGKYVLEINPSMVDFPGNTVTIITKVNEAWKTCRRMRSEGYNGFLTDQFEYPEWIPTPQRLYEIVYTNSYRARITRPEFTEFIGDFLTFLRKVQGGKKTKNNITSIEELIKFFKYNLYWDELFKKVKLEIGGFVLTDSVNVKRSFSHLIPSKEAAELVHNPDNIWPGELSGFFMKKLEQEDCFSSFYYDIENIIEKPIQYETDGYFGEGKHLEIMERSFSIDEFFPKKKFFFYRDLEQKERVSLDIVSTEDTWVTMTDLRSGKFYITQDVQTPIEGAILRRKVKWSERDNLNIRFGLYSERTLTQEEEITLDRYCKELNIPL